MSAIPGGPGLGQDLFGPILQPIRDARAKQKQQREDIVFLQQLTSDAVSFSKKSEAFLTQQEQDKIRKENGIFLGRDDSPNGDVKYSYLSTDSKGNNVEHSKVYDKDGNLRLELFSSARKEGISHIYDSQTGKLAITGTMDQHGRQNTIKHFPMTREIENAIRLNYAPLI